MPDSRKKEGFMLFTGMYDAIKDILTLEQKGMLFDAIHDFQQNGKEPPKSSPILIAFAFYKNQFRLNETHEKAFIEKQRINGGKGGRPRKNQKNPENPSLFSETQKSPNKKQETKKDKQESNSLSEKERTPDFDGERWAIEFQEIYSLKAGKPRPTKTAFAQCLIRMMGSTAPKFESYQMAFLSLKNRAAEFMAYHTRAGTETRFIPNPENWLDDDSWKIDWHQKSLEYKKEGITAKGGLQNGKSHKESAREYTDAAIRHANESGL